MRYSSRWAAGILAALVAVLTLALPAIADTVTNDVTSSDPAFFEVDGGSEEVAYTLNQTGGDGQAGCNAIPDDPSTAADESVTLTITPPAGLVATPSSVKFTGCGDANKQTVVYTATTPGVYAPTVFAFAVTGGRGGTFNTSSVSHQVIAYDLESFTLNPAASPLNCTGIVTDAWEPGDTVCLRIFAIPNTLSAAGALTFDITAPGGAVTSIVGPTGGNRSAVTYVPSACGTHDVSLRPTFGGEPLDTDSFEVCSPPELTVPADITVDTNDPAGASVTFTATATDVVRGVTESLTPTCSPASGEVFPVGPTTVECSVTDASGLSDTGSFDVTVNLYQAAFEAPVDGPSVVNVAKVGRVIPVKAAVSMNGGAVTSGPVTLVLRSWAGCGTGAPDGIETFAPAGSANEGNAFRWADGRWIYNLNTSGLAPGCYQGQVLTDGHLAGWFLIRLAR